jgi:hypothetical protein
MSERWMNRPRTVNVWEVRRASRYGSEHRGHFKTEDAARSFALEEIAEAGNVGRIEATDRFTLGGVVYYGRIAMYELIDGTPIVGRVCWEQAIEWDWWSYVVLPR